MEDNTNDKDLDSIFTRAIEPVETEPSDQFWRKASEEILKRENSGFRRSIYAWKGAALLLSSVVVLLSAYVFYVHTEITSVERKVALMEKQQHIASSDTENRSSKLSISSGNKQQTSSSQNEITSAPVINNASIAATNNSVTKAIPGKTTGLSNRNRQNALATSTNNRTVNTGRLAGIGLNAASSTQPMNVGQPELTSNSTNLNESAGDSQASTANFEKPTPVNDTGLSRRLVMVDTSGIRKPDSTTTVTNNTIVKPKVLAQVEQPAKVKNSRTPAQRIYIAAFFAPKFDDDILEGDDKPNNLTSKDVKMREDDEFSFGTGLRIGYDISPHFSLFTGFYYHVSTVNIKPILVPAQQLQDGEIGYSVTTSSGIVNFTEENVQSKIGDSIKASIQSSRNYISIPFQLRYDFTSTHRIGFYLTGGTSLDFASSKTTDIHWEDNNFREGDVVVKSIPDMNELLAGYAFAVGAKYLITRHLSVFLEPGFDGSFIALNNSAPIKAYPLVFGISGGLTYHF